MRIIEFVTVEFLVSVLVVSQVATMVYLVKHHKALDKAKILPRKQIKRGQ